jgi:hypothetical protein
MPVNWLSPAIATIAERVEIEIVDIVEMELIVLI